MTTNLIACPDCGTAVSTRAESCPKCGAPIRAGHLIGVAVFLMQLNAFISLIASVVAYFWLKKTLSETMDESAYANLAAIVATLLLLIVTFALAYIARSLRQRRRWSWGVSMIIFACEAPGILGLIGLWALLQPGTRGQFGIGKDYGS